MVYCFKRMKTCETEIVVIEENTKGVETCHGIAKSFRELKTMEKCNFNLGHRYNWTRTVEFPYEIIQVHINRVINTYKLR